MPFFVYVLASQRNGTLYLGYTDNLCRHVTEHKALSLGGSTAKYNVERLVDGHEGAGGGARVAAKYSIDFLTCVRYF